MPPRLLAVCLLLPLVAGCTNRVFTDAPLFVEQVGNGVPSLRDGTWVSYVAYGDCKHPRPVPPDPVPRCRAYIYRSDGHVLGERTSAEVIGGLRRITRSWDITHEVVVAGDPWIIQTDDCHLQFKEEAVLASDPPSGAPAPDDRPEPPHPRSRRFCYWGAHPIEHDRDGSITALDIWPVLCGPLPPSAKKQNVTDRPWPGVTLIQDNCMVADITTLRMAARLSRDVARGSAQNVPTRWLHDGYRSLR